VNVPTVNGSEFGVSVGRRRRYPGRRLGRCRKDQHLAGAETEHVARCVGAEMAVVVAEADVDGVAGLLVSTDEDQQRIEVARVDPKRDESPAAGVVPVRRQCGVHQEQGKCADRDLSHSLNLPSGPLRRRISKVMLGSYSVQ